MSREKDDKAMFELIEKHSIYADRGRIGMQISAFGRDCIAYGRATPDREMLKRFADFLYTQEIIDITGDYSDSIDQFLTLESQRGEDERG